jgi:hypothetical protein
MDPLEIILEMARTERECLARAELKIRARQLGLAWKDLPCVESAELSFSLRGVQEADAGIVSDAASGEPQL